MKKNVFSRIAAVLGTAILLIGMTSCHIPPVIDLSGNEISKTYSFSDSNSDSDIHGIKASGIYDVRLINSDKDSVCVHADSELFPYMEIEKENGILTFGMKELIRLHSERTVIRVEVFYVGALDKLQASGASKITIDNVLHTDKLTVELSGASNMNGSIEAYEKLELSLSGASDFKGSCTVTGNAWFDLSGASNFRGTCTVTEKADIEVSGASDIKWEGYMKEARMEVSGSSDIQEFDMKIDHLEVEASGASDVKVTVNKTLNARASGSADILYRGTPEVKSNTSGAGSVNPVP